MEKHTVEQVVRKGAADLERGDVGAARAAFQSALDAGFLSEQLLLLLAHSCSLLEDFPAQEAALDRLLAVQPSSLRALIMKGDCRARIDDRRGATAFYKRAQGLVESGQQVSATMQAELARVGQQLKVFERDYQDHLSSHLASSLGEGEGSARFLQSLEILAGRKQIYLQQPSAYYFPELPQRQFYNPTEFSWGPEVERATADIKEELAGLFASKQELFSPYLTSTGARPRVDFHGLADNPDWSTFYLIKDGAPVDENVKLCPRTYEAIQKVPLPQITTRAPAVFFSRLRPGARIPAHTGMLNTRLICHLPLVVPDRCGFRVGNETKEWHEGELLIFDDTIEHEAWNESDQDRIVLIFDIWRPELSLEERRAVTAVFEAVDSYGS